MKIIIAGDYCDTYRVSEKIKNAEYAALFDKIKPVVQDADVSIVNFEFPIILSNGDPIKKTGPNISGHREAVDAIKYAGFDVCTLANNHILDQGEQCCLDTKRLLEEAGIQTVGVGRNIEDAASVLYIKRGNETIAIINCCENEFSVATDYSAGANPLNPIRQYNQIQEAKSKADFVLVIVHGGHEHFRLPSLRMKEIYHFFITVGADAVVNHHQHCYSGYENYSGKPIVYGIGNFLFDWNSPKRLPWNEGYLVELDTISGSFQLIPYLQCLEQPHVAPMNEDDRQTFFEQINRLNSIIKNDAELSKQVNEYYQNSCVYELSLLEPYQGKILNALFARNLLPRFMRGDKLYQIINHINCESHLDKLRYALRKAAKL